MKKFFYGILAPLVLLCSCNADEKNFLISQVNFFTGLKPAPTDSTIQMTADLDGAVLNGIEIPSKSQTPNGYFNFSFRIKNTSAETKPFYYKLYYQNETYKFKENHALAGENFYGSWENPGFIFKSTGPLQPGQEIEIKDSFKIVGNPRNERVFYGADLNKFIIDADRLKNTINYMKTIPDWVKSLGEKAKQNNIPVEDQFIVDALWSMNDQRSRDSTYNNRWKRNPRMGRYSFMLVVTTPEDFDDMPAEVKDISRKDLAGNFVNPFAWFHLNLPASLENTRVLDIGKNIQVRARIDLAKGVYIDPLTVNKAHYRKEFFSPLCNDSLLAYKEAQVSLFFHNINKNFVLRNIPEVMDVTGDNYTRDQYAGMLKKYSSSPKLVNTYVNSTDCPCKNLQVDTIGRTVTFWNPGNKEGEFKKEHVGMITRLGFTYGKFRAKIKFPEMISKDNVWNGITNAFWMIAQDVNANWNLRRPCNAEIAYIPKNEPDEEASLKKSKKQITYSEIDFEIIKESQYWPLTSYGSRSNTPHKTDRPATNRDVMVTCTNWDMACHQPKNYLVGANEVSIDGNKYILHRWNSFYKALTTKVPVNEDEMFKAPYYYFEIEWSPEKITWKIGPEKDKMRVICVMDETISAIPNNQMLMIITQEWHNQEWWPTAPFKQNFIPFPKNNIIGKVLELEIE